MSTPKETLRQILTVYSLKFLESIFICLGFGWATSCVYVGSYTRETLRSAILVVDELHCKDIMASAMHSMKVSVSSRGIGV